MKVYVSVEIGMVANSVSENIYLLRERKDIQDLCRIREV